MGIKQLSKLVKEKTKNAVVPRKFDHYYGEKIAIDAPMSIYQFLVAVRSDGAALGIGDRTTSHLSGMFYRTVKLVESGITPVYVFDGSAPALKVAELRKRADRREKAAKQLEEATRDGDKARMEKWDKRQVKLEAFHIEECQKLLQLMGVPYLTAVSEAEAYCAYLCKTGCVKGVATEDMDALCFGTPFLLRNLNASQIKRIEIDEYRLNVILKELNLTMDAFIDMCILLGCDFCDTIKGVGPKRALDYIQRHGSIEQVLENERLEVPEGFDFKAARLIFKELSEVGDDIPEFRLDRENIDREGLVRFMCDEKGFDKTRIENGIERMIRVQRRAHQLKLDSFFGKK